MFLTYRSRKTDAHFKFRPEKISTALFIFTLLVFFFTMVKNQFLYLDPSMDEMTYMNPDRAFHIGLVNALAHGFPMESPWMSGTTYYYHIFAEMLLSVPARIFNIPSDQLLLSFGPYLTTYAFATPMYAVFREMMAKPERAGLYCMALMMSNIFLARGITKSIAFHFVFGNENVAGYATGCGLAFVIMFKYWYDAGEFSRRSWIIFPLVVAMLMLVTGIKGPFGLTLLAGIWGTLLIGIVLRKVSIRFTVPVLILSVAFIIVYIFVLGSKGQSGGPGGSHLALARVLGITFYKTPLIAWMKAHGIPLFARYIVLLVTFTFFMLTAFFIPFVAGYIRELFLVFTGRKEYYFPRVLVYASFIAGFVAMMILKFNGRSQIYFGFLPVFLAVIIGLWFLEDIENNMGFMARLVKGLYFASLIACAVTLCIYTAGKFDPAYHAAIPTEDDSRYFSISKDEYHAMKWIRENTPEDALLATDRYYSVDPARYEVSNRWDNRFFLYADYSNRTCYLEGSGYTLPTYDWAKREERIKNNDRLYDPKDSGRNDLAKELGVDYVIVSKDFTHIGDLSGDGYELCYTNEDIDVYEVK